jgi:hypothetical protein
MNDFENEMSRVISICPFDLQVIENERKQIIITNIKEGFVKNDPRALWVDFKYIPISIDCNDDYPYHKIPNLVSNDDEILYFIIDYFNEIFYVLEGNIKSIMFFIEECEELDEYYIVNNNFSNLICENDHDDLCILR